MRPLNLGRRVTPPMLGKTWVQWDHRMIELLGLENTSKRRGQPSSLSLISLSQSHRVPIEWDGAGSPSPTVMFSAGCRHCSWAWMNVVSSPLGLSLGPPCFTHFNLSAGCIQLGAPVCWEEAGSDQPHLLHC